jgi:hypothetical protein
VVAVMAIKILVQMIDVEITMEKEEEEDWETQLKESLAHLLEE